MVLKFLVDKEISKSSAENMTPEPVACILRPEIPMLDCKVSTDMHQKWKKDLWVCTAIKSNHFTSDVTYFLWISEIDINHDVLF